MSPSSIEENILSHFIQERPLSFAQIQSVMQLSRKEVAYHLTTLINQKRVEYTSQGYRLVYEEKGPFTQSIKNSLHLIIVQDNKVLLSRRTRKPYKHYWELPSTELDVDHTIEQSSLAHAKRITGSEFEFVGTNGVVHRKLLEKNSRKHTNIILVCTLKPIDKIQCTALTLEWFAKEELTAGIIAPCDLWALEHLRDDKTNVHELFISEENNALIYSPKKLLLDKY